VPFYMTEGRRVLALFVEIEKVEEYY
jgi:hypothetical protein